MVEFDVDERGSVNNPKILNSNLKEYYGNISLAMRLKTLTSTRCS